MTSLVLIHLGTHFPSYLEDCIHQARLWNSADTVPLYLLVNACHAARIAPLVETYKIQPIYVETLMKNDLYKEFLLFSSHLLHLNFRNGYQQYIFERYFVWEAFLRATGIRDSFFLESDNLLYCPLSVLAGLMRQIPQGLAMPFDAPDRGGPSILYARNADALVPLLEWIDDCLILKNLNDDMRIYGLFRLAHPEAIFPFPVLPAECNTPLRDRKNLLKESVVANDTGFLSDVRFPVVFDTVVYGQAISGIDPRNSGGRKAVGHVNIKAIYTAEEVKLGWARLADKWIPVAGRTPIVNLHIHSKALKCFLSDRTTVPQADYDVKAVFQELIETGGGR